MSDNPHRWRIGVDTGGTFTDFVLVDPAGLIRATHKRLSTPDDPGQAVLDGINHLLTEEAAPDLPAEAPHIVHGSTVATNALLEHKGATAALVTTAGFEDVLAIARQNRPELYALMPRRPRPGIARAMTRGADERIGPTGEVLVPLSEAALSSVVDQLAALDPESIAVCLLHSYANPEHERRIARAVRGQLPGVHLTVSHALLPEFREYERTATCAANARVGPVMSRYLAGLDTALDAGRLRVMGSGGGTRPVGVVCDRPIETVISGPAGGAIGAWTMAQAAGIRRAIGFDMGGTSTDLTLLDGEPSRTTQTTIAGLPIRLPMIDIHTVGAGGGSIARLDLGGALRVGPDSAGAVPGPACYGRQDPGTAIATVTDAHAVLGHLAENRRLGGALPIRHDAAAHAIGRLAKQASMTPAQTALGVLRIADAAMARAVKAISVQRGHDPRAFTLLAFGGAGGLHACRLAEALGMSRVLIPQHGGVLSAVGMLTAPPRHDFSLAAFATLTPDAAGRYPDPQNNPVVRGALDALDKQGRAALSDDGVAQPAHRLTHRLDLRYAGQSHELSVRCDRGDAVDRFHAEHKRLYGYVLPGRAIEAVTARVEAQGQTPIVRLEPPDSDTRHGTSAARQVPVTDETGSSPWACWPRAALVPGQLLRGPLIVEEYAATTVVPPAWNLEVLADGQLSLTR